MGKDPLISATLFSKRSVLHWGGSRSFKVAEILTLPRHRFFLRNSSELAVKYKVSLSSGKLRFRTPPASRKRAGFSGFCGMDLARNVEISQRFMLSGREDSETKQGDPSSQKWSPHFKFQI
jgi:hypothetical protein